MSKEKNAPGKQILFKLNDLAVIYFVNHLRFRHSNDRQLLQRLNFVEHVISILRVYISTRN